jgi:uncharacterized membrane protein YecN with MAPEG domain
MTVTTLYAAPLAALFLVLSFAVIRRRRGLAISIGDGGDTRFARLIRGHGNFAEYVPITLLLMAFAEMGGAGAGVIHAAGISLLIGRLLHAYALGLTERNLPARNGGMILTFAAMVIGIGA